MAPMESLEPDVNLLLVSGRVIVVARLRLIALGGTIVVCTFYYAQQQCDYLWLWYGLCCGGLLDIFSSWIHWLVEVCTHPSVSQSIAPNGPTRLSKCD